MIEAGPVLWCGPIGSCAICQRPLCGESEFADVEVPGCAGAWSLLCSACLHATGASIAWGAGQRYQRRLDGWALVDGGPPPGLVPS